MGSHATTTLKDIAVFISEQHLLCGSGRMQYY